MAWEYEVSTTWFYRNGHRMFKSRYAGAMGFYNDPSQECVKNRGPLPRGKYRISDPINSKKTGRYALPLIPDKTNVMCGRDAFQIHGENEKRKGKASEGCIILNIDDRRFIWNSGDRELIVRLENY